MSAVGLESFEHSIQLTHIRIDELAEALPSDSRASRRAE